MLSNIFEFLIDIETFLIKIFSNIYDWKFITAFLTRT